MPTWLWLYLITAYLASLFMALGFGDEGLGEKWAGVLFAIVSGLLWPIVLPARWLVAWHDKAAAAREAREAFREERPDLLAEGIMNAWMEEGNDDEV